MKKITLIFLLICGYTYSQNLVIESGASLTIEKTGSATVGGNFSNSGTVTMNSDADEFSAIKISGTANGNITYNRFVNYAASGEWDLIGSPVDGLSISAFINTNTSGTATLATNGSAFAVGYYDNSTDTWTNYTTGTVGGAGNFDHIKKNMYPTSGFQRDLKLGELSYLQRRRLSPYPARRTRRRSWSSSQPSAPDSRC